MGYYRGQSSSTVLGADSEHDTWQILHLLTYLLIKSLFRRANVVAVGRAQNWIDKIMQIRGRKLVYLCLCKLCVYMFTQFSKNLWSHRLQINLLTSLINTASVSFFCYFWDRGVKVKVLKLLNVKIMMTFLGWIIGTCEMINNPILQERPRRQTSPADVVDGHYGQCWSRMSGVQISENPVRCVRFFTSCALKWIQVVFIRLLWCVFW